MDHVACGKHVNPRVCLNKKILCRGFGSRLHWRASWCLQRVSEQTSPRNDVIFQAIPWFFELITVLPSQKLYFGTELVSPFQNGGTYSSTKKQ